MLFLLNDKVIEVEAPEARVMQRWREMGCGDPRQLRAQEAVEFVKHQFEAAKGNSHAADQDTWQDIAALIIAKTGANSLILKPTAGGGLEPRLRDVPPLVLETYKRGAANDQGQRESA